VLAGWNTLYTQNKSEEEDLDDVKGTIMRPKQVIYWLNFVIRRKHTGSITGLGWRWGFEDKSAE
jgi:hypothetical protein